MSIEFWIINAAVKINTKLTIITIEVKVIIFGNEPLPNQQLKDDANKEGDCWC